MNLGDGVLDLLALDVFFDRAILDLHLQAHELTLQKRLGEGNEIVQCLDAVPAAQDSEPFLAALAALPLEERYVWRVISALKWAFCDLETESAIADFRTLSEEDRVKVAEPLTLRATQFCLFVNALLGEDATERIMQHALRCAKESSTPESGE
ncbi:MAG TPA: hypothetical protein VGF01_12470 [Terracidiphilus sp.]